MLFSDSESDNETIQGNPEKKKEIANSDEDSDMNVEESHDLIDDEVDLNASFLDYENNMDTGNLEDVIVTPNNNNVPGKDIVYVANIKDWLKHPWTTDV